MLELEPIVFDAQRAIFVCVQVVQTAYIAQNLYIEITAIVNLG